MVEHVGKKREALRKSQEQSIARAARMCKVGERIWRRWEKGEAQLPIAIVKLYMMETGGDFRREEWE